MGAPRALTALAVALIATVTALVIFFQVNAQPFASPLDQLSAQMDAGKDASDPVKTTASLTIGAKDSW